MIVRPTLLDTQIGKQADLHKQITQASLFLIKNHSSVLIEENSLILLKTIKNFGNSNLTNLFDTIVNSNKFNQFICFDYSRLKGVDIPEVLTMSSVSIDGESYGVPKGKGLEKIWCNLTPFIKKRTSPNEKITINDINKIQEIFIRGALCKSYNNSRTWLNPEIASLVIESYAITITNILSSAYKLTFQDTHMIMVLFAAYYAQLFNLDGSMEAPELLIKCKRLNKMGVDIFSYTHLNKYREHGGKGILTIKEICNLISSYGPSKMSTFNINVLNSLFSRGTVNVENMLIALEYPPYYMMQLIKLADNEKNLVISSNPNSKKDALLLVEKLRTEPKFIPKL